MKYLTSQNLLQFFKIIVLNNFCFQFLNFFLSYQPQPLIEKIWRDIKSYLSLQAIKQRNLRINFTQLASNQKKVFGDRRSSGIRRRDFLPSRSSQLPETTLSHALQGSFQSSGLRVYIYLQKIKLLAQHVKYSQIDVNLVKQTPIELTILYYFLAIVKLIFMIQGFRFVNNAIILVCYVMLMGYINVLAANLKHHLLEYQMERSANVFLEITIMDFLQIANNAIIHVQAEIILQHIAHLASTQDIQIKINVLAILAIFIKGQVIVVNPIQSVMIAISIQNYAQNVILIAQDYRNLILILAIVNKVQLKQMDNVRNVK
ncbi:unnamed protein product [Paramecium octaurelia]|uniref:Transmembrane protein n=1 Tax=Paramecium octaurelia TaxID=43137 RepID=A0A8S1UUX5_PAROT|nr:unnamed protein product [Paramecium octaurelia]